MAQGDQVKNGKAFEYALAVVYAEKLRSIGILTKVKETPSLSVAKAYFEGFEEKEQSRFREAAIQTFDTIVRLEPGLTVSKCSSDILQIYLNTDDEGENGDVRDVVFQRQSSLWEIGFSAKNNNDAVKHSRLSSVLDFGKSWLDIPCSKTYWDEIAPIFTYLEDKKQRHMSWDELGAEKTERVYSPLLNAFKEELMRINKDNKRVPQKLIEYLIGSYPFYKIIKDDRHNLVVVKAFNIKGQLNKTVNGVNAQYKTPQINLPTRIVEFEMKTGSDNTLNMILDGGWEISFRIHNASTRVEKSLKFDIRLLGNPPVLFTQHLFQNPQTQFISNHKKEK